MFSGFKRSLPEISIFHRPSSPPSVKALALLRSSLSGPYPPSNPSSPPLQFNLEVVESAPTPDQLRTISSYISAPKGPSTPSPFLSAHPAAPSASERPQSIPGLSSLGNKNPSAFQWPIVVDWTGGQAAIGDVEGVKRILEVLRQKRDGEWEEEEEFKPKGWFS